MTEVDPYNYPFPTRNQTMYLQTVSQNDVGFRKVQIFKPDSTALKTADISGANPILPGYRFSQKETFVNRTNDIEGCRPRNLIKEKTSRSVFNLRNDDIKGTQPQINKFCATRQVNPLCPEYKLPSAQIKVSTPPKFIRDNINITDIEGTRPNPYNLYKLRKTHIFEEVEGSKPKKLFVPKDQINIMDVRDINEYLQFKTSRVTNPLNPVYLVADEEGKKMEIGEIEFSKSRQLHPVVCKRDPSLDLKTRDIDGAWAGTLSEKFLKTNERKDFRQPLKVEDIPGAQVSTLRKGITTNRKLNPIWPFEQYPYLGVKEDLSEKVGTFLKTNGSKAFESKSAVLTQGSPSVEKQSAVVPVLENPISNKENEIKAIEPEKNATKTENIGQSHKNSRKSSGASRASKGNHTAQNLQKTGQSVMGNPAEPLTGQNSVQKDEKELKSYQGFKDVPPPANKVKLSTAQNFDKFINK